jgi:heme-degrading monooxygenase HmoA
MTAIASFPPDSDTMQYGQQRLPQRRFTPGAVGALDGTGEGPERAGALSLVYGSFPTAAAAQRGYRHFTDAQHALVSAPGFLRWLSFSDGPHGYGLGMWRSADDAASFARSGLHQAMVREQRTAPFEMGQFAGIWTAHTIGRHLLTCPTCHTVCTAPARTCTNCASDVSDGFS